MIRRTEMEALGHQMLDQRRRYRECEAGDGHLLGTVRGPYPWPDGSLHADRQCSYCETWFAVPLEQAGVKLEEG